MAIISKEVEVVLCNKNIKYYENIGYYIPRVKDVNHPSKMVVKRGTKIKVKIDDLPKNSSAYIDVQCDYCNKILRRKYQLYNRRQYVSGKDSCKDCRQLQAKANNLIKYGIESKSSTPEVRAKVESTTLKNLGVKYPSQSPIVREKITKSYIEKYGVDNPGKSVYVRQKMSNTLYKNNTQKASSQQLYISSLYDAELNYPIYSYNVDMAFPNEKLLCEYNGGGHWLNVETGRETQEEFNKKEIIRNNVIKKEGWKQIIIISRKDYLPSDEKLLEILEYSRNFFKENPNRSWIEFDIDNSTIRNALCKDNAQLYNFGELRKLPRKTKLA